MRQFRCVATLASIVALLAGTPADASTPFTSPSLVWDSGVINSGATSTSTVRALGAYTDLEVVVDNTAGAALRDLTMTSFAPDGVTTIDQVLLRRVAYGTKPTGATHDPGRARGYVGPNPPGGTNGYHILFDGVSATNANIDPGGLFMEDCDQVWWHADASAGTTQTGIYEWDDTGTPISTAQFSAAGTQHVAGAFGPGSTAPNPIYTGGTASIDSSRPVPRRARIYAVAAGTGNTVRLRIVCRGRPPGTFAVQMVLPMRAQFSVSAANGTAHVWVLAR